MKNVQEYLLTESKLHLQRSINPVVAIDLIAGKFRSERLMNIAEEMKFFNLDDTGSIAHLVAIRDGSKGKINTENSMSLVFTISEAHWFDGIVDRVSRESIGWIEVSGSGYDGKKMLNLPAYRRMLGINHCVAYIAKGKSESDLSWLERRAEWLNCYHPEIKVIHQRKEWTGKHGEEKEISFGTVASFLNVEHLVEADLITLKGIQMANGVQYEILDVFIKPDERGAIGRVRQIAGDIHPSGIINLRDYKLEVVN